jgi:hypothetical protein
MNKMIKKALDAETQRKLAGLLPCNNDFTITFVPEAYKDIDEAYRPSFTLKPYSSKELKEVVTMSQSLTGDALDNYANKMIASHVTGWSNMINISTGDSVEPDINPKGGISMDSYDIIPMVVKKDLMSELMKISSGLSI